MTEKVKKEEGLKCDVCTAHFEYTQADVKVHRTWLPWWLGGHYFYVVCPGCGEHLVVGGMR
jgi:hypothetical protein